MATLNPPPELLQILGKVKEVLEETLQETAEPLDASPHGKDILALVEDVQKVVGRELSVYQKIIGAGRYHGRIFTFCQEKKGKRMQWVRSGTHPAEPEFIAGGADHLRSLMMDMVNAEEGKALAMWVNPLPGIGRNAFIAFVLHEEGLEAAFAVDGGRFLPLPWGPRHLDLSLEMLLRRPASSERRWANIVDAQMTAMREELREDVTAFVAKCPAGGPSDELWDEFLALIYLRKGHLLLLQEMARATGASLLMESQRLIAAMVELVEKALASHNEKLASMEKAHARALKRFKTDLDKYKASRDVATNRTKQLGREVQMLQKQVQRAGTGEPGQLGLSNKNSLGLALDRFFLEPERT